MDVSGRANSIDLGTNHYLDVSFEGKTWSHGVSTVSAEHDVNG